MKTGFVGLGTMGRPIALNLARNHVDLIVHDSDTKRHDEFVQKGVGVTTDRAHLASCQIIFLCLPDDEVVRQVLFGESGIGDLLAAGTIICDLTTMDYMSAIWIGEHLAHRRIAYLDAPVSGMQNKAIDATLTVMCGGEMAVYETLLPLLKHVGRTVLYMGTQGCGQLSKTINNVLFDINIAALAELLPFAVKLGLDPESIGEVINSSSGGSFASAFFIPRILDRNFDDGYPMREAYKDLVSCMNTATEKALPLPVTNAALTTYQMALLQGLGARDKGAMACVLERLLGVEYMK